MAESAVLAMEPDVPDTRKMLIRVRRNQSMAAIAVRYGVSVSQVKALLTIASPSGARG